MDAQQILAKGNTRTVALLGTSTMGPAMELPGKSFLLKIKEGFIYLMFTLVKIIQKDGSKHLRL